MSKAVNKILLLVFFLVSVTSCAFASPADDYNSLVTVLNDISVGESFTNSSYLLYQGKSENYDRYAGKYNRVSIGCFVDSNNQVVKLIASIDNEEKKGEHLYSYFEPFSKFITDKYAHKYDIENLDKPAPINFSYMSTSKRIWLVNNLKIEVHEVYFIGELFAPHGNTSSSDVIITLQSNNDTPTKNNTPAFKISPYFQQ